jgi:hypothetical protein
MAGLGGAIFGTFGNSSGSGFPQRVSLQRTGMLAFSESRAMARICWANRAISSWVLRWGSLGGGAEAPGDLLRQSMPIIHLSERHSTPIGAGPVPIVIDDAFLVEPVSGARLLVVNHVDSISSMACWFFCGNNRLADAVPLPRDFADFFGVGDCRLEKSSVILGSASSIVNLLCC